MRNKKEDRLAYAKTSPEDFLIMKSHLSEDEKRHEKSSPIYSLLGGQKVVQLPVDEHKEIDAAEVSAFRRTVAGLEWLMLVLVILCMKLPGMTIKEPIYLVSSLVIFAFFICVVHYVWQSFRQKRWKLALNTWAMIIFITAVVWQTGALTSPLLPLYFLVVMLAATTLGWFTTMLETMLITVCYILLAAVDTGDIGDGFDLALLSDLAGPIIQLFLIWLVAVFISIIAKESDKAKEKIRELSRTDQLTGLWNMKMLLVYMQREYQRTLSENGEFAIMMIDADNLKKVNDTHGHDAGTMLIVAISEIMRSELTEEVMLARFGGDEFVALLPKTDCEQASKIADNMCKAIAHSPLPYEDTTINITVSIGIAGFPEHGKDLAQIMKMADKALYRSKHLGKNRCTIFQKLEE